MCGYTVVPEDGCTCFELFRNYLSNDLSESEAPASQESPEGEKRRPNRRCRRELKAEIVRKLGLHRGQSKKSCGEKYYTAGDKGLTRSNFYPS